MFKNLIISLMGSWIITNMDFWIYDDTDDRVLIFIVITMVLFIAVVAIEDAIKSYMRSRYMKQWRVNRFKDVVEMNTRPTREQECDEIIRSLADARRSRR